MNTVDLHCKAYSYKEKYLQQLSFFQIDHNQEHYLKYK